MTELWDHGEDIFLQDLQYKSGIITGQSYRTYNTNIQWIYKVIFLNPTNSNDCAISFWKDKKESI